MTFELTRYERAQIKARMAQILARDPEDYAARILYRQVEKAVGLA